MSILIPNPATNVSLGVIKVGGGLSGAADGTASVVYGAGANTAAAGNDTRITGALQTSQLGVASGVASLDSTGKLPTAQLPASIVGAVVYQGVWNASTNSPSLTSGTGTKGQYYKVGTAGTTTLDGISQWYAGDSVIYDGTTWDKIDGVANEVLSVAGRTGAVVLVAADISGLAPVATSGSYSDLSNKPAVASYVSSTYSASGAIALTDDESIVSSSGTATLAMTLANNTTSKAVDIKRGGTAPITITANIDGASQTVTFNATNPTIKESLSLRWNVTAGTYFAK